MNAEKADAFVDAAAAYVHIPFCSAVCPYCDFAVVAGQDELVERYVDAVTAEIEMSVSWKPLNAIYFGGGTPSHVPPRLLGSILDALSDRHGIAKDAEISLEANPEDFARERADALIDAGFNRVSFGAQSFDDAVLATLGRRHSPGQIAASVATAREAGFACLSIDLIYGDPVESGSSWERSLEFAVEQAAGHISCYALTVERGTPLGRAVAAGARAPDPDDQADRYERAHEVLTVAGLDRYEVSNWSVEGEECRYNLVVWAQGEYEAYGNGAHGFRNGVRFRNHRRLEAYMEGVESGKILRAGTETIAGWDAELDRLFVGLRRSVGVTVGPGTEALLNTPEGHALVDAGVIALEADRLVVRRPLLTDAVHRSVLATPAPIVIGHGNA